MLQNQWTNLRTLIIIQLNCVSWICTHITDSFGHSNQSCNRFCFLLYASNQLCDVSDVLWRSARQFGVHWPVFDTLPPDAVIKLSTFASQSHAHTHTHTTQSGRTPAIRSTHRCSIESKSSVTRFGFGTRGVWQTLKKAHARPIC